MGEIEKQLFIFEEAGKAGLRVGPSDRQRIFWGCQVKAFLDTA